MKNMIKLLFPGLGVKRWAFVVLLGLMSLILGIAVLLNVQLLVYLLDWVRNISRVLFGRPLSWLVAVVLIAGGIFLLTLGSRRLLRSILLGLIPDNNNKVVEILYQQRRLKQGPKIVAIGGGTGLSVLLRGLKQYTSNLTAVVTVTDDGGSSGRLRGELGILPPGDARNCLVALADTEKLMEELFNYRFTKGDLQGHNLGNLLLAAMTDIVGNFDQAVQEISRVLAIRGQVYPSTLHYVTLRAHMEDDSWVDGETEIVAYPAKIQRLFLNPHGVEALPEVLEVIKDADAVVLGPGSLYTSIIPNLLVKGMVQALHATKAPVFYVCNVMTQPGETDDYTVSDHIKAINRHTEVPVIDYVIVNNQEISPVLAAKYREKQAYPVKVDEPELTRLGITVIADQLIDETNVVRHHPDKLARRLIKEIFRVNNTVERLRMLNAYWGQRIFDRN